MTSDAKYCIDTSCLINFSRYYPTDIFHTLWTNLSALIKSHRLIAPREVKSEIEKGHDYLVSWAKQHSEIFINENESIIEMIRNIMSTFPKLIDPTDLSAKADPWVIALAVVENKSGLNCIVVADERTKDNPPSIPFLCNHYGIECLKGFDFFRQEGLSF